MSEGLHIFHCWCCAERVIQNKPPEKFTVLITEVKHMPLVTQTMDAVICEPCGCRVSNEGGTLKLYVTEGD